MGYEIQKLNARHRAMVNFFLCGCSQREIAERFIMTEPGVNIIYNSPLFQSELHRRQAEIDSGVSANLLTTVAEAKEHLEENALFAAEELVTMTRSASDQGIKLRAINSLLDKCFETKKAADERPVIMLSAEQVQVLNIAMTETQQASAA